MSDDCPAIRLANGAVIDDPLEQMRTFIDTDGSYQLYDMATVAHDSTLTEADIRVANRFVARMSAAVIAGILERREQIDAALATIPADASLTDEVGSIPWEALGRLFEAFDGVPAVGLARITKVMHRKRPALIPILDSVVEAYLIRIGGALTGTRAERAVALTRVYKQEMDSNAGALRCLRGALAAEESIDLTECRLLDVFVWTYSGGYEPVWIKDAPARSPSPTAEPRASASRVRGRSLPASDGLMIFRDAERDYLNWVASNEPGFVLNTERSPKYLVLHLATCRFVSTPARTNYTTGQYIKVCSRDLGILERWAVDVADGAPHRCGSCWRSSSSGR